MVEPRVMATNAHVMGMMFPDDTKVYFPSVGEKQHRVRQVVHFDEQRDLCLLELDSDQKSSPLGGADSIRRGEDVIIIGNPAVSAELILKNAITKGLVSSEVVLRGQKFYQFSASINPGNSGGPVVNQRGEVIAIATLKASEQEGIAFGIPASDVSAALAEVKVKDRRLLEQVHELYVAKVLFRRLCWAGAINCFVMEEYAQAMDNSIQLGRSAGDGLQTAQAQVESTLAQINKSLSVKTIEANLRRLQKSVHIGTDIKKNLLDLWACSQEMHSYVDNPRGSLISYREKAGQLRDEFERLFNLLKVQLDVILEDDLP